MLVTIGAPGGSNVTISSSVSSITISASSSTVSISSALGPRGLTGATGYFRKVAVSGSPHSSYGALTMANSNTEATIPGTRSIDANSIIVTTRGLTQTDFTFSGRTVTMGFTPSLSNKNRMVIQYDEI